MRVALSIYSLIFTILSAGLIQAQSIQCIKATQMSWSWGIAGHYGTNYFFTFKLKGYKSIIPDTIWIGDMAYPLFDSATHKHAYTVKHVGVYTYVSFTPADVHDENYNYPNRADKINQTKGLPPPNPYKYPAILQIMLGGNMVYVPVKHIDALPRQSYP